MLASFLRPITMFMHSILSFLRRHRTASIITAVVVFLLVAPILLLLRPKGPQYLTAVAERGDLQQTVEAVGTVTSERDLELKFPTSGIVSSVTVQEGDHVAAGQILAQLRSGNAAAAIAIQSANVEAALANLHKLQEGARPEDIAISQAQVANAQAALQSATKNLAQAQDQLQTLQLEANTTLLGQVQTSLSTVSAQLVTGETALSSVDDVLSKTVVLDAITKSTPGADATIRSQRADAATAIAMVRQRLVTSVQNYQDGLKTLEDSRSVLTQVSGVLDQLFSLLTSLPETAYFTASSRETYKTTVSTQRGLVQSALSAVTAAYSSLQTASATYDTRIATSQAAADKAQNDIQTYQTALQTQQASLTLKLAGARQADLDAANASVRQAQGALAQAESMYSDTLLRSPVDGVVTHVNVKVGEAAPLTDPAMTVLGNSPFRVEMYVSEVDVPRLARSQSGTLELDAFPGVQYKVHVSEIDSSPTLVQNVSKYRVKLDFQFPHDDLKIGMTGDVTVISGERQAVVKIPSRAVIEKADGSKTVRILGAGKRVSELAITTGMEGQDGAVEVTSGLQGGETIIVLQQ